MTKLIFFVQKQTSTRDSKLWPCFFINLLGLLQEYTHWTLVIALSTKLVNHYDLRHEIHGGFFCGGMQNFSFMFLYYFHVIQSKASITRISRVRKALIPTDYYEWHNTLLILTNYFNFTFFRVSTIEY